MFWSRGRWGLTFGKVTLRPKTQPTTEPGLARPCRQGQQQRQQQRQARLKWKTKMSDIDKCHPSLRTQDWYRLECDTKIRTTSTTTAHHTMPQHSTTLHSTTISRRCSNHCDRQRLDNSNWRHNGGKGRSPPSPVLRFPSPIPFLPLPAAYRGDPVRRTIVRGPAMAQDDERWWKTSSASSAASTSVRQVTLVSLAGKKKVRGKNITQNQQWIPFQGWKAEFLHASLFGLPQELLIVGSSQEFFYGNLLRGKKYFNNKYKA